MKALLLILWLSLASGLVQAEDHSEKASSSTVPASSQSDEAPRMEVPERAHHLGKLSYDRPYEHSFQVINTGTGVLEIEKVTVG